VDKKNIAPFSREDILSKQKYSEQDLGGRSQLKGVTKIESGTVFKSDIPVVKQRVSQVTIDQNKLDRENKIIDRKTEIQRIE